MIFEVATYFLPTVRFEDSDHQTPEVHMLWKAPLARLQELKTMLISEFDGDHLQISGTQQARVHKLFDPPQKETLQF